MKQEPTYLLSIKTNLFTYSMISRENIVNEICCKCQYNILITDMNVEPIITFHIWDKKDNQLQILHLLKQKQTLFLNSEITHIIHEFIFESPPLD